MPGGIVVIGTRVLSLPFALCGGRVRTPAEGTAADTFRAAQADGADLVRSCRRRCSTRRGVPVGR